MDEVTTIHICGGCRREGHVAQVFPVEVRPDHWEWVCSRCREVVGWHLDMGKLDLGLVKEVTPS